MLPESVVITSDDRLVIRHSPCRMDDGRLTHSLSALPDDIAEAVLRDAMQEDAIGFMRREVFGSPSYEASMVGAPEKGIKIFHDADHGGSLGACFKAWSFAKGIA